MRKVKPRCHSAPGLNLYLLVPIGVGGQPFIQLALQLGLDLITATVLTLRYAHNGYRMNKKIMK